MHHVQKKYMTPTARVCGNWDLGIINPGSGHNSEFFATFDSHSHRQSKRVFLKYDVRVQCVERSISYMI